EGPDSSLDWQPAQPGPLAFLGQAGEWLQTLRPSASWQQTGAAPGGAAGGFANHYTQKGGRTPARITLAPLTPSDPTFALVIRAERRSMAWWRVERSQLVDQVAGGVYRPPLLASLGDLAAELTLMSAWASALALAA